MPWASIVAISSSRRSRTCSSESCRRASMRLVTFRSPHGPCARGMSSWVQGRKPSLAVRKKYCMISRLLLHHVLFLDGDPGGADAAAPGGPGFGPLVKGQVEVEPGLVVIAP